MNWMICITCKKLITEPCCYGRARPAGEYEIFMGRALTPLQEIDVRRELASILFVATSAKLDDQ